MYVNRRTFAVKSGRTREFVQLLEDNRELIEIPYRIYLPEIASFDTVAIEIEFADMEAYQRIWHDWNHRPETAAFMEKWRELRRAGGSNEIWKVV